MKIVQTLLLATTLSAGLFTAASANAATCPSAGCDANWLNVPGDFANPVNNFTMYLLGGWFNIDYKDSQGKWHGFSGSESGGSAPLNTAGIQLDFIATQFNHIGPGQGTSALNASFNHLVIGSGNFFELATTIYADGQASGTLVDNADSTQGHWTLNTHLYADWGDILGIDLGLMPLSTNASYSFNMPYSCDINGNNCTKAHDAIAAGNIMDYHSGLAYLVGQGTIQDGPFPGFRVTVGLQGQDPLAAPVPIPSAAWLLGSGLIGLVGAARKRKVA